MIKFKKIISKFYKLIIKIKNVIEMILFNQSEFINQNKLKI